MQGRHLSAPEQCISSINFTPTDVNHRIRSNNWNLADCFTVILSISAVCLYIARMLIVSNVTKLIGATR